MAPEPAPAAPAYRDNPILAALPGHLAQFIVDQNYSAYTPVDHAVWRYVMRQNYAFLKDHAHPAYVDGLRRTGIGIEKIPSIEDMNEILGRLGWAAVPVDGFIPPAAFMEFQAHNVLVIAAAMRQIDHIEYTPAPDIIHEAAGHAPIIADPEYADYLRRIGAIGAKAMSSKKDYELYEAIRRLSILKESDRPDPAAVARAEQDVAAKQAGLGPPSEMARLSRLHWWTVEYGLIGDLDCPRIYGAGLLSSIGESASCLGPEVRKIPYTLDAADYPFDITTQQPHLFVTPDFARLTEVLEQFAATMAFRVGGAEGLAKALECENVSTAQFSSGLQVSGVVAEVRTRRPGAPPCFFRTAGPTALALDGRQLAGHGRERHRDGFSSPIGTLRGQAAPLERMSDSDLAACGLEPGRPAAIEFESGLRLSGRLESTLRSPDRALLLMTFSDCTVADGSAVLFRPEWGPYDMAVGASIVSVFAGAADKSAYQQPSLVPRERTVTADRPDAALRLLDLYRQVRDVREGQRGLAALPAVWEALQAEYPCEWLLPLEILEICRQRGLHPELAAALRRYLERKALAEPGLAKLIRDGLALLDSAAAPN
ncbi:MAG TPA: aromatic amino acid hydroxylase [candidate division Zixibacteria bacterium]|nr:aromatic amino acid hydroxylase [candidate division Zixibacteria bacterium]MDD4916202.1 aromatic amino acid hydroxylase [candidate division Zixibacteria bacterium]MDM7972369.1 aromatic amino acid hydroxylase [candidate division Zixibacteria bacterium]HOD66910.1 aromatic amino acid hydroxylase [candidate division Zixibacteria bacterium]HPI32451.1 aromatic amino acid hydroxylase [candidate division Zixibacteria bacterium]